MAEAVRTVYVVLDTKGNGRVVGVFERETDAFSIAEVSPQYYRLQPIHLNEINPECVRWVADAHGREKLTRLSTQVRAIADE